MLLGGLWHGANWTFVIWGGIHGAGLSIERFIQRVLGRETQPGALSIWFNRILIFHLVCLTWIFFRASSIEQAFAMLSGIGRFEWIPEYGTAFAFLAAFTMPMFLLDLVNEYRGEEYFFQRLSATTRAAVAMSLVLVAVMFAGSSTNAFIYFQF